MARLSLIQQQKSPNDKLKRFFTVELFKQLTTAEVSLTVYKTFKLTTAMLPY